MIGISWRRVGVKRMETRSTDRYNITCSHGNLNRPYVMTYILPTPHNSPYNTIECIFCVYYTRKTELNEPETRAKHRVRVLLLLLWWTNEKWVNLCTICVYFTLYFIYLYIANGECYVVIFLTARILRRDVFFIIQFTSFSVFIFIFFYTKYEFSLYILHDCSVCLCWLNGILRAMILFIN